MAQTLRDRTDACLRALGVHTLRDMKQVEAPCAAEPLPDELRGWLGGDADELRELAECLAAWLGIGRGSTEDAPASSRPAQFWDVHIFKKVVFLKMASYPLGASSKFGDTAFGSTAVKRAEVAIEKRRDFIPRKRMWIRRTMIVQLISVAEKHEFWKLASMLFLTAYVFMLRAIQYSLAHLML